MTGVLIFTGFIFILIMCLSFFTINKGYAYKHTIDERPTESNEKTHQPK
ncbi:YtzI protein [Psychrobacillus vulpis]|uniref:YtzI protein n=1 Tax=Psychrobacillus vulpis TaxID=2325572 RepID=A0A544TQK3_9BACI|nr:YtzI protein [Psychrobacillus vulpis]TQR19721.1 YtzI protein [Psychrobacillus vulpis]